MKRLLFVAVAGLCTFAHARAQDGAALAPTVPVVPAPVVQNGNLLAPAGGNGTWGASSGPRAFSFARWAPFRNPATASVGEPAGVPSGYGYPVPPLPAGVGGPDGLCGAGGCATARGHDGSCLTKIKNWLTYHPCKTELPKFHPTPYITPLQGMFPCTSVANCGVGCGSGNCGYVYPGAPVQPEPPMMPPPPMQPPMKTGAAPQPNNGAGAVAMPARGTQGAAVAPTWQGRVAPMPPSGVAGYRFAAPEAAPTSAQPAPLPGTVVNTGAKVLQR